MNIVIKSMYLKILHGKTSISGRIEALMSIYDIIAPMLDEDRYKVYQNIKAYRVTDER